MSDDVNRFVKKSDRDVQGASGYPRWGLERGAHSWRYWGNFTRKMMIELDF